MNRINLSFLIILSFLSFYGYSQDDVSHEKDIKKIVFTEDDKFVITGGDDNHARVWNVGNGKMVTSLEHLFPINRILVSPDNNYVITSNGVDNHCFWNLKASKMKTCMADNFIQGFTGDSKHIIIVSYHTTGRRYANIGVISVDNLQRTIFPHKFFTDSLLSRIYPTQDGQNIFVINEKSYSVLDLQNPKSADKHKLKVPGSGLILSPDTRLFYSEGNVVDIKSFKNKGTLPDSLKQNDGFAFINGGIEFWVMKNGYINYFVSDSAKLSSRVKLPDAKIMTVSHNGNYLAYTNDKRHISLMSMTGVGEVKNNTLFQAMDLVEKYAYSHYQRALYHYSNHNCEPVIEHMALAENKSPIAKKLYLIRGKCYMAMGQYDKAIADFLMDNKLYNDRSTIELAEAYAKKKDYTRAFASLYMNKLSPYRKPWKQLHNNRNFDELKKDKGWYDFKMNYKITESEKLVSDAEYRVETGMEMSGTEEYLNRAISLDPHNPEWYRTRAAFYVYTRQYYKAIDDFKKEVELDSTRFSDTYMDLAKVFSKLGKPEKSIVLLEEVIRNDPDYFSLYLELANIEISRHNKPAAIDYLNTYLEIMPEDYNAYYERALLSPEYAADMNKAIELCKSQGKLVPKEYYDLLGGMSNKQH